MGTRTPWGTADSVEKVARGVVFYGTSGHGGYHLSKTVNAQVHPALRDLKGWYEEDQAYAIVVFSLPGLFDAGRIAAAITKLKNHYPDAYEAATGHTVLPVESRVLRERILREKHKNDYVTVSAYGDWHKAVPKGFVGVFAVRGGRSENGRYASDDSACFLVPEVDYNSNLNEIGFVVDPTRHERVKNAF
jgi:hypothetical protein